MSRIIHLVAHPGRRGTVWTPLLVVWGLGAVILVGTLLLLPVSAAGARADLLTALFTSASAACTTGLVTVDTGAYWSVFGQVVIVVLMEVGGLGFLVSASVILLALHRDLSPRERELVQDSLETGTVAGTPALVRRMIAVALGIQAAGALLLALAFMREMPARRALWFGGFHAVSAFTNASFDLFSGFRSFQSYRDSFYVLGVLITLVVLGGISFAVLADLWRQRRFTRLSLDTKLVLVVTGALLAIGFDSFFFLESARAETIGLLGLKEQLLQSAFFAVVPQSAGFSTLNVGAFKDSTLVLITVLMFIGGAAASTAGGIKVNTLGVLVAAVWSAVTGRPYVQAFEREIRVTVVMRALTVVMLAMALVLVCAVALTITESHGFLVLLFEATSAFGTVGLSTGITPGLSTEGQLILILLMFVGRLGPLMLAVALVRRDRTERRRYPREPVRIG